MLSVSHFDVPADDAEQFLGQAAAALAALAAQRGYLRGRVARAADDPTLWVVVTEWQGVGSYRRSLSSVAVRVQAGALFGRARPGVSAFEVLHAEDVAPT